MAVGCPGPTAWARTAGRLLRAFGTPEAIIKSVPDCAGGRKTCRHLWPKAFHTHQTVGDAAREGGHRASNPGAGPMRCRVIATMTLGMVGVGGEQISGSLISARLASNSQLRGMGRTQSDQPALD